MMTPWGRADYVRKAREGVYSVGTPGHGGVLVGREVARLYLSEKAQAIGEPFGTWLAFEEDCNWAAVGYEHPEWLLPDYRPEMTDARLKALAEESLRRWHAAYFEQEEQRA